MIPVLHKAVRLLVRRPPVVLDGAYKHRSNKQRAVVLSGEPTLAAETEAMLTLGVIGDERRQRSTRREHALAEDAQYRRKRLLFRDGRLELGL